MGHGLHSYVSLPEGNWWSRWTQICHTRVANGKRSVPWRPKRQQRPGSKPKPGYGDDAGCPIDFLKKNPAFGIFQLPASWLWQPFAFWVYFAVWRPPTGSIWREGTGWGRLEASGSSSKLCQTLGQCNEHGRWICGTLVCDICCYCSIPVIPSLWYWRRGLALSRLVKRGSDCCMCIYIYIYLFLWATD